MRGHGQLELEVGVTDLTEGMVGDGVSVDIRGWQELWPLW